MPDTPERAIAEAGEWLEGARNTSGKKSEGAQNVCCAQAIHSIIRANDALCMKFMKHKPTRHEDIPRLLEKMINQGKIKPEERKFEHLLAKAMASKSGADYGKVDLKWSDAEFFLKGAEEFVSMAERYI